MSHYLPPAIMAFFQARPPLEYVPSVDIDKTARPPITGVAAYLDRARTYAATVPIPPVLPTKQQKQEKKTVKTAARHQRQLLHRKKKWDPKVVTDHHTKDAWKTLFVGRLSYKLTAEDIQKEFEYYGPIVNTHLVTDQNGKSRGYAFIEFQSSKDLTEAYKDADGRKIAGRRIVVDVERGRTVKNWIPRRLGGGLGATRLGGKDVNKVYSGREGDQKVVVEATPPISRHNVPAHHHPSRPAPVSSTPSVYPPPPPLPPPSSSFDRSHRSTYDHDRDSDRDHRGSRDRDSHRSSRDRDRSSRSDHRSSSSHSSSHRHHHSSRSSYDDDNRHRADRVDRWERDRFKPDEDTAAPMITNHA